jgi:hypothetical protein
MVLRMNSATYRPAATTAFERATMPTTCECCKREGLKRTVKMTNGDAVMWMGVGCAAKGTGISVQEIKRLERDAQQTADDEAAAVARAEHAAFFARWSAHLDALCPPFRGRIALQVAALGGMKAASAGFVR